MITGGTGSLGQALTKKLLDLDVDTIRILSRNESKQVDMDVEFNDDRLRFLIGDIRDKERLIKSLEDIVLFNEKEIVHKLSHQHLYTKFWIVKNRYFSTQHSLYRSLLLVFCKAIYNRRP